MEAGAMTREGLSDRVGRQRLRRGGVATWHSKCWYGRFGLVVAGYFGTSRRAVSTQRAKILLEVRGFLVG